MVQIMSSVICAGADILRVLSVVIKIMEEIYYL